MNPTGVSRSFPASLAALAEVQQFVCLQAGMAGGQESLFSTLELVMEELFVNIINHAKPRRKPEVEIACALQNPVDATRSAFCVSLRDWGPRFNPLDQQGPKLEQDVETRPIGGLGIHLVTQMADHFEYRRHKESNLFTVCFHL